VLDFLAVSGMICLSFRDRFDILLEKRPSGVAELRYAMLYGKSQSIPIIPQSSPLSGFFAASKELRTPKIRTAGSSFLNNLAFCSDLYSESTDSIVT